MKFYSVNKQKVKCPTCSRKMIPAISIRGTLCDNWMRCEDYDCKTFLNTAILMPHQQMVVEDPHKRVGVFGAYGSGKTFATYQADEKHILITPHGETLIGANTLIQLDNTIKKDLEGDFPAEFVSHYNKMKNKIEFINGHVLYYRTLAEEEDIRSYNLTRAHLLEASNIKHDSYVQLQARVRNEASTIPELNEDGAFIFDYDPVEKRYKKRILWDWTQLYIESNPDPGWIKSDILLKSSEILLHDIMDQDYYPSMNEALQIMSSHVMPTKANYNLGPDFYRDLKADKPAWWIKRFVEGSFEYAEGLVYPNAASNIIPSFPIPNHWPRIVGFDYGLNDNSHFVFGAIDWFGEGMKNGKPAVYWYTEVCMNNANITQLAMAYKAEVRRTIPTGGFFKSPVMDARSYSLRSKEGALKTLGTLFAEQGCYFRPAQMNLDARLFSVNVKIDSKQMFFFEDGVPKLIAEIKDYKYPEKKLIAEKASYTPIDKNNHGVNAMEFATMELPPGIRPPVDTPKAHRVVEEDDQISRKYYNPMADFSFEKEERNEGLNSLFHY